MPSKSLDAVPLGHDDDVEAKPKRAVAKVKRRSTKETNATSSPPVSLASMTNPVVMSQVQEESKGLLAEGSRDAQPMTSTYSNDGDKPISYGSVFGSFRHKADGADDGTAQTSTAYTEEAVDATGVLPQAAPKRRVSKKKSITKKVPSPQSNKSGSSQASVTFERPEKSSSSALAAVRSELEGMKPSELKRLAKSMSVESIDLDTALDAESPQDALVEIVFDRKRIVIEAEESKLLPAKEAEKAEKPRMSTMGSIFMEGSESIPPPSASIGEEGKESPGGKTTKKRTSIPSKRKGAVTRRRSSAKAVARSCQVYCRIRPPLDVYASLDEEECTLTAVDSQTVQMQDVEGASFEFDGVFSPGSQEDIFLKCKEMIQGVVKGCNATILAYGQADSGKSYTMHWSHPDKADDEAAQVPGIMPRAFHEIFKELEKLKGGPDYYSVRVSVMELHRNSLVDLLDERRDPMDDHSGIAFAHELSERESSDPKELKELLRSALLRRRRRDCKSNDIKTGATATQRTMLVMVTVVREDIKTKQRTQGKLVMGDLVSSDQPSGIGPEARDAHDELTALRDVLEALRGTGETTPPYDKHLLTKLLKLCSGVASRTALIVNCIPTRACRGETLRSLQYAACITSTVAEDDPEWDD
jgi:hypothetical protein